MRRNRVFWSLAIFFQLSGYFLVTEARGAIAIDANVAKTQGTASTTIQTAGFSTSAGNELLLAFVATDGVTTPNTTVTSLSGGGLTWVLVRRTNVQLGTSEVWRAFATAPLTGVTVTATLSQSVSSAMTVLSFTGIDTTGSNGSGAIGATGSSNGSSGAPSASLLTTRGGSLVLGVGNDWDRAVARTLGAGQTLVQQFLAPVGDTYWIQRQTSTTPASGTNVTINDTAPTNDRFNLTIVEVLASAGSGGTSFSVSGSITPAASGTGATVVLSQNGTTVSTAVADAAGNYTFLSVANGTYAVTPSKAGFAISPASQNITVNGANATVPAFTAAAITYTLSGSITPASSGAGATVTLSGGASKSTTADAAGNYSFSGLANGNYTVTPSKTGFTFNPAAPSVTVNNANAAVPTITATPVPTFSISGTITGPGAPSASLTLSGAASKATTADSSGNYNFTGLANGTYVVTPSKTGFTFSPTTESVTVNGANATAPAFSSTANPTFTVSGTITGDGGGASVSLTQGSTSIGTVTANASGAYSFNNIANGTYTVTPSKTGFTYTPATQSVTVNGANATVPAFTAQSTSSQLKYPDFSVIVPTSAISIVQTSTGREFRYTHDTYNGGAGPLEIQPVYNSASGNYQGFQHIYTLSSGKWTLTQSIPIAGTFIYHPIHGHFHFPLVSFGLYTVNADGTAGTPVAMSPKVGFCISDSFIYNSSLPNAGAFGNWGACSDPTSLRGLSIGAVDEYDHNDPGQSVPIDGLPDGTYWFRAIADPNNFLTESDKSNNETDVKVTIAGNNVTILQSVVPVLAPPPVITMATMPASGTLSGMVTLTASAATGRDVQYLLDGLALGDGGTTSPYSFAWDTTTATNGTHWLAAQTTDANGRIGTSSVVIVTVSNGTPPPPPNAPTIDRSVTQNGHGAISASISTTVGNDLIVAFVSGGGPSTGPQTATVNGGGLVWTLSQRSNSQAGTAEIWTARASGTLSNASITSTLASSGFDQSLTLIAFKSAGGIGAVASKGAAIGPAQVGLTSTQAASWTFGVGFDWDSATAPTLAGSQTLQSQWVDTSAAETFWVQSESVPSPAAGEIVNIADVAPIPDRWNLAAIEILPSVASGPDTTPPTVQVTSPTDGSTVSGSVTVAATATDDQSIPTVTFYVDNLPIGAPVSVPPFMVIWDTSASSTGQHTITASAQDAAGNVGSSAPVSVNVDNTHPPNLIGRDVTVFADGGGTLTTPTFTTPTAGDLFVAFVGFDGPSGAAQTATVSGGGLTWTLVQRSNTQHGTAEIWSATAAGKLTSQTVTARPGVTGYRGSLTVIAFTNASGIGVSGRTSAPSGPPDIYLPGISTGNWIYAVGNDWDRAVARTPIAGQVLVHQFVDTSTGDTYWVQTTASPTSVNGQVIIHDDAPTTDQWNYAALEIIATHQ